MEYPLPNLAYTRTYRFGMEHIAKLIFLLKSCVRIRAKSYARRLTSITSGMSKTNLSTKHRLSNHGPAEAQAAHHLHSNGTLRTVPARTCGGVVGSYA